MVESTVAEGWLADCLHRRVTVEGLTVLDSGSGCTVVDCVFDGQVGVLKVYHPSFDDFSELGAVATARKNVLAMSELPGQGVPTPGLLGWAVRGGEAAILTERLAPLVPSAQVDVEAAGRLADLHQVGLSDLSEELASLVGRSRRNEQRIIKGVVEMANRLDHQTPSWRTEHRRVADLSRSVIDSGEPVCDEPKVIHGDFFGVNLRLRPPNGIAVIDWDLLSLGDPMWDLAFLIGADPTLASTDRRERILAGYHGPISTQRLEWHLASWQTFWELRNLIEGRTEATYPEPLGSGEETKQN